MSAAHRRIEALLRSVNSSLPEVPGYRVRALLGRGGMGVVYAAQRQQTGELVAIKLLRADIATPATLARFDRERNILARLDHPDIARLLDAGETGDHRPYLVMEYVEGQPIVDYCASRAPDLRARIVLFHRVCRAVAAAHALQIVHRDLKPANILVTSDGRPKLVDFVIAKPVAQSSDVLTATGNRWLTPKYASIEQIRGRTMTPASDVYSLGVILAELSGGTDKRLTRIVARATAEQPESRYASAQALAGDLAAYLEGRRIPPPRSSTRIAIAFWIMAFAALLFVGSLVRSRPDVPRLSPPTPAERDYLVARHLWGKFSAPDLLKAEQWFRKAVKLDPRSALAHAGLADALYFLGELGVHPAFSAFPEAKAAALHALSLDRDLPIAHAVLGSVLVAGEHSWGKAESEFRRALQLDPNCIRALHGYGCLLMRLARFAEARRIIGRARLLDPASPILGVLEARISYYDRRYALAREQLRAVLDRERGFALAHFYLALCNSYLGLAAEAEQEMRQAELGRQALEVELAWLQARHHRPEAGLRLLARPPANPTVALLAGELNRPDRAFSILEQALQQNQPAILALRADPRFDCLRRDPRYASLLRRAGFEP
jgi:Tfp pilus assembly protein PilF